TLAGVLVAWRYVALTRRLAEAANTQASAARVAAEAAADQARTTRLIFEAQRPTLRIRSEHAFVQGANYPKAGDHQFRFAFENHAPVPASITGWEVIIRRRDEVFRHTRKEAAAVGTRTVPPESDSYTIQGLTEQLPHLFPNAEG